MKGGPGLIACLVGAIFGGAGVGCSSDPTTCTDDRRPAIIVEVRDSAGDASVADSARGFVSDGAYVDSLAPYDISHDVPVSFRAADERSGTYAIHVERAGYAAWDTTGVNVGHDECHVITAAVIARLVRLTPQQGEADPDTTIVFGMQLIGSDDDSPHLREQGSEILETAGAFEGFLREAFVNQPHPPPTPVVDFARQSVLVRRMGVQARRGISVTIDSLRIDVDGVMGYAHSVIPGPACENDSTISTPWTAVTIPKIKSVFSWELEQAWQECPPTTPAPTETWHGVGALTYFRFQRRQTFLIDNVDSLAAFWSVAHWDKTTLPGLPTIDFDRNVLFVASAGWTSGCTSVATDSFLVVGDMLYAFISVWYPSGCGWWCDYSFSRPWGAAVIPAPGGGVETRWSTAYYRCSTGS